MPLSFLSLIPRTADSALFPFLHHWPNTCWCCIANSSSPWKVSSAERALRSGGLLWSCQALVLRCSYICPWQKSRLIPFDELWELKRWEESHLGLRRRTYGPDAVQCISIFDLILLFHLTGADGPVCATDLKLAICQTKRLEARKYRGDRIQKKRRKTTTKI